MKITQVIHYAEDDLNFGGDYYSVTLEDSLGRLIAHFGDSYHDRGIERAEGFIAGVAYATGKAVPVVILEIADGLGGN